MSTGQLWAIVLAGGQGRRLLPLTTAFYGEPIPKQYCALGGNRTLLQETLGRVAAIVPPERILLVIGRGHERWAIPQTAAWRGITVLVEPASCDTGPGILLPLAHVLARDPDARVVVMPTDHHVEQPDVWIEAVRAAVAIEDSIALLGVPAEQPETGYGWVVAGPRAGAGAAHEVREFVEKPSLQRAQALLEQRAYWNTLVFSGPARAIWRAARSALPAQTAIMTAYAQTIGSPLENVAREIAYAWIQPASFSATVLTRTSGLVVIPAPGCGWRDLGTPRRVFAAFAEGADFGASAPAQELRRLGPEAAAFAP